MNLNILRRTLPYLILGCLAYGIWYYLNHRPLSPLQIRLLEWEAEEVGRLKVVPAQGDPWQADRAENGWYLSSAERHLPRPTPAVDSLLARLLAANSLDLADRQAVAGHLATISLLPVHEARAPQTIQLYKAIDTLPYHNLIKLEGLPEYYALAQPLGQQLQLDFDHYRSHQLLDVHSLGRLDSLVWVDSTGRSTYAQRPDSATLLDRLAREWRPLKGREFADFFDEIGFADRLWGRFVLYGARDQAELRLYLDSSWQQPLVATGSQFSGAYFSLPLTDSSYQHGPPPIDSLRFW